MQLQQLKLHKPGQRHLDFELRKATEIPELQCVLREFIHIPSGAEVMHIANDDPENVFSLSFRTLPETSNGVAHILEHTVLCGSKKYPIKDPFFSMTRRSLNTFMNALTGPDFTCYPAASQVRKDFYNILDVYLDAVFHPILDYNSFLQEGHRIEFTNSADPKSPLEYKGIVYNEMLGALSSGNVRLHEALMAGLFPDVSYGINSGGDPKDIVTLTYDQLLDFHKKHYHPGKCLFYFYGNIPVEEHLEFISKNALQDIGKTPPFSPIPYQTRFTAPKKIEKKYPIGNDEDAENKTLIGFGWLTTHILEQEELLALGILEIILLETDASILKKALLGSGLCKQVTSYLDSEIQEAPLIITLSGCDSRHADQLEELIFSTLREVIKDGIPLEKVEDAIHQVEFFRSEITGEQEPFGLSLFMRAALLRHHGAEPENGLRIHELFDKIRHENLKNPHYLTTFIQKYIIDNPHFVRVIMKPDAQQAEDEVLAIKQGLEEIRERLTTSEEEALIKQAADLAAIQLEQQDADISVLPKVHMDDIPKDVRVFDLSREKIGALDVFHHNCFTNDIIYMNLTYDFPAFTEEELPLVRLFSTIAAQIGCGGRDYVENLEYMQANTGGVRLILNFNIQADDCTQFSPTLTIRGKALHRKAKKLCALLNDMVTSLNFKDIPRLKELIYKQYIALQESLNSNAIRYALNLSSQGLDVTSKLANAWYGIDYFLFIRDLAENFDSRAEDLVAKLSNIANRFLGLENPDLVVTCDAKVFDELRGNHFYDLSKLPQKSFKPFKPNFQMVPQTDQARVISAPVAFIGKVLKTIPYVHPDAAALCVAAHLCDNVVLHSKIREQGGAYGGGATCNTLTGNFYFYSYRDPNIVSTLDAFDESIKVLMEGNFDDEDVEEAKLEMIQKSDAPIAPGQRGVEAYMLFREGKTTHLRQEQRNMMLKLTKEDIMKAVEKHLLPEMNRRATVVFASKQLIEKENLLLEQLGRPIFPAFKI